MYKDLNMKNILLFIGIMLVFVACDTRQTVIDTGVSSPYFDGTMMEYLRSDKYNWELTVEMIEHAGLTDLFEGTVDTLPEITFFAPPSYSILRFLWKSQEKGEAESYYEKVEDIPVKLCREFILKHVVKGKHLKESIGFRNMSYYINEEEQDGGTNFTCLNGNRVIAYLQREAYAGVADAGAITMYLFSWTADTYVPLASPDIQPSNGVVHALNYGYDFGNI